MKNKLSLLSLFVLFMVFSILVLTNSYADSQILCEDTLGVYCDGYMHTVLSSQTRGIVDCSGTTVEFECNSTQFEPNVTEIEINLITPMDACQKKLYNNTAYHKDLKSNIKKIEKVGGSLYFLGTSVQLIDNIIDTIGNTPLFGTPICSIPAFGNAVQATWHSGIYAYVEPMMCLLSDGWCSFGGSCGGSSEGAFSSSEFDDVREYLNPQKNLYTSFMCGSLFGVITNMRKMEQISSAQTCCIDLACEYNLDVSQCDKAYEKQSCMFYHGTFPTNTLNVLSKYVSETIKEKLMDSVEKNTIGFFANPCANQLIDLAESADKISNLDDQYNLMMGFLLADFNCSVYDQKWYDEFDPDNQSNYKHVIGKEVEEIYFDGDLSNGEVNLDYFSMADATPVYTAKSRNLALSNKIMGSLTQELLELMDPVIDPLLCGEDGYFEVNETLVNLTLS